MFKGISNLYCSLFNWGQESPHYLRRNQEILPSRNREKKRYKIVYTVILFLYCCSCSYFAFSQIDSTRSVIKKNSVFVEGLGNAGRGLYSINYDRLFLIKNSHSFSFRIGGSCLPGGKGQTFLSFPLLLNSLSGHKNHHFELGIGCVLHLETELNSYTGNFLSYNRTGLTANIGYRYQRPAGGFFYKIAYTPVWYKPDFSGNLMFILFLYYIGMGVGFTF